MFLIHAEDLPDPIEVPEFWVWVTIANKVLSIHPSEAEAMKVRADSGKRWMHCDPLLYRVTSITLTPA